MTDDELNNPFQRRLTAPWPFLYTVVPDCGLVMNVGPASAPAATVAAASIKGKVSRNKVAKPEKGHDGAAPVPTTVRRVAATHARPSGTGQGKARKAETPPPVLDWVAPSTAGSQTGPSALEAQFEAQGVSESDRAEVRKFASFLNDSATMKLPDLIERHGAAYLGFTEAELASVPRPVAQKPGTP